MRVCSKGNAASRPKIAVVLRAGCLPPERSRIVRTTFILSIVVSDLLPGRAAAVRVRSYLGGTPLRHSLEYVVAFLVATSRIQRERRSLTSS